FHPTSPCPRPNSVGYPGPARRHCHTRPPRPRAPKPLPTFSPPREARSPRPCSPGRVLAPALDPVTLCSAAPPPENLAAILGSYAVEEARDTTVSCRRTTGRLAPFLPWEGIRIVKAMQQVMKLNDEKVGLYGEDKTQHWLTFCLTAEEQLTHLLHCRTFSSEFFIIYSSMRRLLLINTDHLLRLTILN
ncbi:hypothetical protein U9M48_008220, partial [Paspalum notatum var. saurae]